ncbi:unnamed protein product [Linum tenue]|uniref:Uncharacterized protein n=1 Tax=Linum tenue TaxID=586396 RepID=A0AAV0I083_9ROSI|nr:unnamed protein product [Linum tenue]
MKEAKMTFISSPSLSSFPYSILDADNEMIEYTNSLRNVILEANTGIHQVFKNKLRPKLLIPHNHTSCSSWIVFTWKMLLMIWL